MHFDILLNSNSIVLLCLNCRSFHQVARGRIQWRDGFSRARRSAAGPYFQAVIVGVTDSSDPAIGSGVATSAEFSLRCGTPSEQRITAIRLRRISQREPPVRPPAAAVAASAAIRRSLRSCRRAFKPAAAGAGAGRGGLIPGLLAQPVGLPARRRRQRRRRAGAREHELLRVGCGLPRGAGRQAAALAQWLHSRCCGRGR